MNAPDTAASFVDKWRARWPEWSLAMVFVPASQRDLVAAWFALLQALTDAAWGGSDPAPGLAKLAWWQEELRGWAKGAHRHPLGATLQARAAPWETLARALTALQASRVQLDEPAVVRAGNNADTFAQAVAQCETALFEVGDAEEAMPIVAATLVAEHALYAPDTVVGAPEAWPDMRVATRPRRMHAVLLRARLQRGNAPLPPWRALIAAWRAARGGR